MAGTIGREYRFGRGAMQKRRPVGGWKSVSFARLGFQLYVRFYFLKVD
jgi:hypothetical protein